MINMGSGHNNLIRPTEIFGFLKFNLAEYLSPCKNIQKR